MNITDDIMYAAHAAWETESARWRVDRCSVGAVVYEMRPPLPDDRQPASGALMRFESYEAAQLFKRDKIIRAILGALP